LRHVRKPLVVYVTLENAEMLM